MALLPELEGRNSRILAAKLQTWYVLSNPTGEMHHWCWTSPTAITLCRPPFQITHWVSELVNVWSFRQFIHWLAHLVPFRLWSSSIVILKGLISFNMLEASCLVSVVESHEDWHSLIQTAFHFLPTLSQLVFIFLKCISGQPLKLDFKLGASLLFWNACWSLLNFTLNRELLREVNAMCNLYMGWGGGEGAVN